ncbi:MAG: 2,3-bisphosphoglycerate-independent phosphoglycerate mutase [Parcubacteria group bacterium GW2011_GWA2_44_12]|nr:MAG: 2,3-bisphosphoglycerate-independent phosphoglycerate mutase [Parcubacteria group bacterium GW2011_GWA2_44_12]
MSFSKNTPLVLAILDGWGVAEPSPANAMSQGNTPFLEYLASRYRSYKLHASGEGVGLPAHAPGNSELGHLTLGTGRVFYQHVQRIQRTIASGKFFSNRSLLRAVEHARTHNSRIHIFSLLSFKSRYGHRDHPSALLNFLKEQSFCNSIYLHLILEGTDQSEWLAHINYVVEKMKKMPFVSIGSISGSDAHLNRDENGDLTETLRTAFLFGGIEPETTDAFKILRRMRQMPARSGQWGPEICAPNALIHDNDSIIFTHFENLRIALFVSALKGSSPYDFAKEGVKNVYAVSFAGNALPALDIAFPEEEISGTLADVISGLGHCQFKIAETEKYAHATYFFNGGRIVPEKNEDWIFVPSKTVQSFAEYPACSAIEITSRALQYLKTKRYSFAVANYANADLTAHTGDFGAAMRACEVVDSCLKELARAVLKMGGCLLVTADHGNAENMMGADGITANMHHTDSLVPLIIAGEDFFLPKEKPLYSDSLVPEGTLADVAPTILKIVDLPIPSAMTGNVLV